MIDELFLNGTQTETFRSSARHPNPLRHQATLTSLSIRSSEQKTRLCVYRGLYYDGQTSQIKI